MSGGPEVRTSAHRTSDPPSAPPTGDHISRVQSPLPPYALAAPTFPFPHLAGLAGRAPIGGAREVALACFVAARLAVECTPGVADPDDPARVARVAGAKVWLGTLTLPAELRVPLLRCLESTAQGPARAVAQELSALATVGAAYLDGASRAELDALAAMLLA